nr:hypothetical protein [uncultured Rhodoferax sp.]
MFLTIHSTPLTVRRRTRQASVGLVVLGLHLAGVLVWWTVGQHSSMRMARVETRLPSISVSLPVLAKPDTEQARRPQRMQDPTATTRQRDTTKPADPRFTADVATAPSASGISIPLEPSSPAEEQTPGAPALNLNLSRKDISSTAPRSFAEQSPFRGRLPKTVERQIANAAAETGPWTEERLDYNRIRFRRGNTCLTMHRPNPVSIDPLSEAAGPGAWLTPGPEECTD